MTIENLLTKSNEARKIILEMKYKSKSSHIGSAYSVLDLLIYLYYEKLNMTKENLNTNKRDRLILSKGHASAALYSVLSLKGFLEKEKINNYYCDGGDLPGHIDNTVSEALDVSSGSLGHGLSIGVGLALASKIDSIENTIVVILGDGELNEGSIWEGAMSATRFNLNNLLIIVDANKFQGYNKVDDILNYERMVKMWKSLDFEVFEIDGHNFEEMKKTMGAKSFMKPTVIIANTIKGKGISYMENKLEWHYKSPNEEQFILGKKELQKKVK